MPLNRYFVMLSIAIMKKLQTFEKLGIPSEYPDTVGMLADIQSLEGQIIILKNILSQMGMDYQ